MRDINVKVFNATSITQTTNSTAIQVGKLGGAILFSAQAPVATGTALGTIKLQWSNDVSDGTNTFAPTNWTDVTSSSAASDSSTAYAFQSSLASVEWLRAVFTYTSGTGTVTCRIKAIGVTH